MSVLIFLFCTLLLQFILQINANNKDLLGLFRFIQSFDFYNPNPMHIFSFNLYDFIQKR
jgi:hypothetical protein